MSDLSYDSPDGNMSGKISRLRLGVWECFPLALIEVRRPLGIYCIDLPYRYPVIWGLLGMACNSDGETLSYTGDMNLLTVFTDHYQSCIT